MNGSKRKAREVVSHTGILLSRAIFSILTLVIFLGLAFLTYTGNLDGEAVVLFSGLVLGYLARGVRDRL